MSAVIGANNSHNNLKADTRHHTSSTNETNGTTNTQHDTANTHGTSHHNLTTAQINRYSRQLILSQFGVIGQQCLLNVRILIVGCGGLGSPVALYCAAAGIIHITLIDHDTVDISNLHRQIIHREQSCNTVSKVDSAKQSILQLNSDCQVDAINERFSYTNASTLCSTHDIIVDCSDNVATRYLINDCAVIHQKPVVSGSALKLDGQCTVYNYIDPVTQLHGPCYRCIFPVVPNITTVQNCADGGVIGSVVGIIGTIQANEIIKLACLLKYDDIVQQYYATQHNIPDRFQFTVLSGKLLIFDAMNTDFRKVTLRPRNTKCAVCGDHPTITQQDIQSQAYTSKLGVMHDQPTMSCKLGQRNNIIETLISNKKSSITSITVDEYNTILQHQQPHILLDVREPVQYNICHIPNSINIPLLQLSKRIHEIDTLLSQLNKPAIYTICRRGIDSIHAVELLNKHNTVHDNTQCIANIDGGLLAWHDNVDETFPVY